MGLDRPHMLTQRRGQRPESEVAHRELLLPGLLAPALAVQLVRALFDQQDLASLGQELAELALGPVSILPRLD